jgi:type IV pilus assembly protein PilZ
MAETDQGALTDEERRNQDRAPITLRVEYKRINTFFADYTRNISRGGTFIRTSRPLEIGTEFMFVLSLPAATPVEGDSGEREARQLELKGIVKWVVPDADANEENPAGMGIQFAFDDDAQRLAVDAVVAGMMNEALGPVLAQKLMRT